MAPGSPSSWGLWVEALVQLRRRKAGEGTGTVGQGRRSTLLHFCDVVGLGLISHCVP